ncbi:MAG: Asp-tRNA(Asn)/Glu-tRNA(Gln) amidotransferase subunit GatB [candidate division Zixibacteria bacterium]|nr:Asp-tRNA(Asn)/Glu-tRNA(Gln) amidotransferase subunit GatB [Candidatus Tariuqbacter arcticus]
MNRQPTTNNQQPTTNNQQPTTNNRQPTTDNQFETVIGLEVHAQLKTASKAFCGCENRYGAEPNTLVCPVCMSMPGILPVVNRRMVEMGILAALALGCRINRRCKFDRKNYFYPDLPKGYQISQYDQPLAEFGKLHISGEGFDREVTIVRAHLEEDAGKSFHQDDGTQLVDLNRCGVPLIEIVSGPDMRHPEEAAAYLNEIKTILQYIGVCDANMEKGELRCDANLSVRLKGAAELGVKTEVKNMNSFRGVVKALTFEMERQIAILEAGGVIEQATMLWDESKGEARPMRSKEESHDYRYFPEPDLIYLEVPEGWESEIRRGMPELPAPKRERFTADYSLREDIAAVLCAERPLADYFEAVTEYGVEPAAAANWITGEVLRIAKGKGISIEELPVDPEATALLLKRISEKVISASIAKEIFAEMVETGASADRIIESKGLKQISDEDELLNIVRKVLDDNQPMVEKYLAGKTKLFGAFMGQVMKATKGKANPQLVNEILRGELGKRE